MYITRQTDSSFSATFVTTSYEEYRDLGLWVQGYGNAIADQTSPVGPTRLTCPVRNFDKVAIPAGVEFGVTVAAPTYSVSMRFTGARDPVPLTADFVSSVQKFSGSDASIPYFYPTGTQLSGDQKSVDSLYDVPAAAQAVVPFALGYDRGPLFTPPPVPITD